MKVWKALIFIYIQENIVSYHRMMESMLLEIQMKVVQWEEEIWDKEVDHLGIYNFQEEIWEAKEGLKEVLEEMIQ